MANNTDYKNLEKILNTSGCKVKFKNKGRRPEQIRINLHDNTIDFMVVLNEAGKLEETDVLLSKEHGSKFYLLSTDDKIYNICVTSKLVKQKQYTPQNLNITDKKYSSHIELSNDIKNVLSDNSDASKLLNKVIDDDFNVGNINGCEQYLKDFGEIIAGVCILKKYEGNGFWLRFPGKANHPLIDIETSDGNYAVKSAGGSGSSLKAFSKYDVDNEILKILVSRKSGKEKFNDILKSKLFAVDRIIGSFHGKTYEQLEKEVVTMTFGEYIKTTDIFDGINLPDLNKSAINGIVFAIFTRMANILNGNKTDELRNLIMNENYKYFWLSVYNNVLKINEFALNEVDFKYHYWANIGNPFNNLPGFKTILR